jgi:hypothetical protein
MRRSAPKDAETRHKSGVEEIALVSGQFRPLLDGRTLDGGALDGRVLDRRTLGRERSAEE